MRKLLIIICLMVYSPALAVCDWAKDIKENLDGSFTYTRECHIEVGKKVKTVTLLEDRIDLLEEKIELKDLMISKQDERAQLWLDTSIKLNEKIQTYDRVNSTDRWASFGLGVGVAIVSVWAAGQLIR